MNSSLNCCNSDALYDDDEARTIEYDINLRKTFDSIALRLYYARPMANVKLPKSLDPDKSAQKRAVYDGVYVSGDLQRLNDAVASVDSDAHVKVEFAKDAQGLTYFQGRAEISVSLVCERTSKTFALEVKTEFCCSPVQGMEEAEFLPEIYEPIEIDKHGAVDLFQLIEDELILSLPVVALHPEEEDAVIVNEMQFGELAEENERPNPFAVLKELKRD